MGHAAGAGGAVGSTGAGPAAGAGAAAVTCVPRTGGTGGARIGSMFRMSSWPSANCGRRSDLRSWVGRRQTLVGNKR